MKVSANFLAQTSAFAVLLAGLVACQSGGGETGETMSKDDLSRKRPKISQDELEAYCPAVRVRQGTEAHKAYAKGGQDDATKLTYQASIATTSRACTRSDGMMMIEVAVAGRIVPGPAGAPGSVTLPIRIAATRGDEVLYSDMVKDQVTLSGQPGATQFLVKQANITFPIPDKRNVVIFVGFDGEGAKAQ